MSTPIQQDELSPDDPIFYAPPKWRTGERRGQVPESAGSADWTASDDGLSFAEAFTKSRRHSGRIEHSRVRITALACAVAVIAWTAFCVTGSAVSIRRHSLSGEAFPHRRAVRTTRSMSGFRRQMLHSIKYHGRYSRPRLLSQTRAGL